MNQKYTFWDRIDRFPPILIRLLARHPYGKALTTAEIVDRSGLSPVQVEAISQSTDWTGVDIPTARRFVCACAIDLANPLAMKRVTAYLRGKRKEGSRIPTPFAYLKRDPQWETYFSLLRDRWLAAEVASIRQKQATGAGTSPRPV